MARKKKEPEAPAGSPAWMATFCDMMTLVLVFFVLLYSMSTVDVVKWKSLVVNLSGDPSIFEFPDQNTSEGDMNPDVPPVVDVEQMVPESDEWSQIVEELQGKLAEYHDSQDPSQDPDSDSNTDPNTDPGADPNQTPNPGDGPQTGIFISIDASKDTEILIRCQGDILFDNLSADVKEESLVLIDWIIEELVIPQVLLDNVSSVRIEGHTDSNTFTPGSRGFQSNWDLSYWRAQNVFDYVRNKYPDADESKFSPACYADSRPVHADGRYKPEEFHLNRRVEFVMVRNLEKLPKTVITNPVSPEG